jgi:acyl-CoA hydrolase
MKVRARRSDTDEPLTSEHKNCHSLYDISPRKFPGSREEQTHHAHSHAERCVRFRRCNFGCAELLDLHSDCKKRSNWQFSISFLVAIMIALRLQHTIRQNAHIINTSKLVSPRIHKRCFQSRADYEQWTHRMKTSRMITNPPRLTQVNAKTAAPFLYSVSPMSTRLLLYAAHEEEDNKNDDTDSTITTISSGKSPSSSMLECIYPLSESRYLNHHGYVYSSEIIMDKKTDARDLDILRASVSDPTLSRFRLAKFYSDVDALTADVAYRHAAAPSSTNVAFVTAGHYHSRKIHQMDITNDIILRCYPTHTGSSSMEIRTDALQRDANGNEMLMIVCFTSMVAVDKDNLRPIKNAIPKLTFRNNQKNANDDDGDSEKDSNSNINRKCTSSGEEESRQQIRTEMAQQHAQIRKKRFATSMQLRHGPSSSPPTQQEMTDIHALHQRVVMNHHHTRSSSSNADAPGTLPLPPLPHVHQHTYRSSVVIYPEKRNVHGKLFGGFVMEQGHILAQYAADFYLEHSCAKTPENPSLHAASASDSINDSSCKTNSNEKEVRVDRAIPLGMDEAIFLQPIGIGDHVTFTARVVYSTSRTCRIIVVVEVRDPANRHLAPLRSNRLTFLFGGSGFPNHGIVPDGYDEILMHVDAKRRMGVEGPLDEEVERILSEI